MQEEIALTDVDVEEALQQALSDVQAMIYQNKKDMPELYQAGAAPPTG
jgi:phosphoketolase